MTQVEEHSELFKVLVDLVWSSRVHVAGSLSTAPTHLAQTQQLGNGEVAEHVEKCLRWQYIYDQERGNGANRTIGRTRLRFSVKYPSPTVLWVNLWLYLNWKLTAEEVKKEFRFRMKRTSLCFVSRARQLVRSKPFCLPVSFSMKEVLFVPRASHRRSVSLELLRIQVTHVRGATEETRGGSRDTMWSGEQAKVT